MSWRTAMLVLGGVVTLVLGWAAFRAAVATKAEVLETTKIVLEPGGAPTTIASVVQRHDVQAKATQTQLESLSARLGETSSAVITVRNGFFEDRAERLADRAADKVSAPRRSREVWKSVKDRAMQNQREEKPLRDGIQSDLVD
jgi:hypothetical protein